MSKSPSWVVRGSGTIKESPWAVFGTLQPSSFRYPYSLSGSLGSMASRLLRVAKGFWLRNSCFNFHLGFLIVV